MNEKRFLFLIFSVLVCSFSFFFEKPTNPLLLILLSLCYVLSLTLNKKGNHYLPGLSIQLGLLISLQAVGKSDWYLPLFLLHMNEIYYRFKTLSKAMLFNLIVVAVYSVISLIFYKPHNAYGFLNAAYMAAGLYILSFLFRHYIHDMKKQTQALTNEKTHLSTYDALTGLYNLQEFHRKLEYFVTLKEPIVLVLIDCKDLKSLNTANGFHGGNQILKQIAQLLKIMFPYALIIARYGGDEFAIVLKEEVQQQTINTVTQLLASEFPRLTGIEINFGIATCHSKQATSKDDLILAAEHNLYIMKRESWLKREEHMLTTEKLRVVGELASGMAHEIRNPLTTIKGFIQLSKVGNYNIEPWYELIMDEINRMSMLTAEFLQFSKPHVTQYKVHSLQNCIYRIISLLDSETTRLGHCIEFEHDTSPIHMLMDQDKMLQLLLNLVKNAFEAMQEQGIVHIRLFTLDKNAVIEVSDNGKGIPETELDKIFHPFYTTKESGTGLGLSICHKIVQDHHGTIEVESIANKGTKFTITLPVVEAEDNGDEAIGQNGTTISA